MGRVVEAIDEQSLFLMRPKRRRNSISRLAFRAGIGFSVLIVSAWIATLYWEVTVYHRDCTLTSFRGLLGVDVGGRFQMRVRESLGPRRFLAFTAFIDTRAGESSGRINIRAGLILPRSEVSVDSAWSVRVPYWLLLLLAIAVAAAGMRATGPCVGNARLCLNCGYNLTGCVSEQCSECGATLGP